MTRRSALVAATTVFASAFSALGGATPAAQANYCQPGTPIPPPAPNVPPQPPPAPELPPRQGNEIAIFIVGAYDHVGGTQLDAVGCVNGTMVHDTRYIPPRADYVVIAISVRCTPGQVFGGGTISGLGVHTTSATATCSSPHPVNGSTAAMSGLYYLRKDLAGSISATFNVNGRVVSTTARTLLPVNQPV